MWPMFYIESEPVSEIKRPRHTVNRLFEEGAAGNGVYPPVNAWTSENEAVVTAEVPGADPKSISVTVSGDLLKIEGEKKPDVFGENGSVVRQERSSGRFSRTIRLPFEVESAAVKASGAYGVLRIALPRKESTKPRQIAVEAN